MKRGAHEVQGERVHVRKRRRAQRVLRYPGLAFEKAHIELWRRALCLAEVYDGVAVCVYA